MVILCKTYIPSNNSYLPVIIRNIRQYASLPRLTTQEVSKILRSNEYTKDFNESNSIKYYDTNQLSSNNPIEDTRSEARCKLTNGFLFGIFDGHGGDACAHVIAKRLFYYVSTCLVPPKILKELLHAEVNPARLKERLLDCFNDNVEFLSGIDRFYGENLLNFAKELTESTHSARFDSNMKSALENAFLRLDRDIANEMIQQLDSHDLATTLSVGLSGAVAVVAHIDGPHLHVAGVGDCQAVLGVHNEGEGWSAKMMTVLHNIDNAAEVERILSGHPESERKTILRHERLLGQLAPLRAFGDLQYKLSKELLHSAVVPYYGEGVVAPNYHTPPYLTAEPEVTYHRLTPKDKFLIIASDGLWDLMSPSKAVRLVGEHMSGKMTLSPLVLPSDNMKLSEINEILLQRKEGLKKKPLDENAATHLLRNALGATEHGIDHKTIVKSLTLPSDLVRFFRDDITITVVYLDSEFLRHCP